MAGLNKVILVGNLGKDPEMRYTPDGVGVTDFSVAVTDGSKADDTMWFRVSCWRNLAELTNKHLRKGRQVYVEGRLRHRTYTRRDGSDACALDVVADKVVFLGRKSEEGHEDGSDNGFVANGDAPDAPELEDLAAEVVPAG